MRSISPSFARPAGRLVACAVAGAISLACGRADGPTDPGDDDRAPVTGFDIDVRFVDEFTDVQERAIRSGMVPWEEALDDLPEYPVPAREDCFTRDAVVDDVFVAFRKDQIDGAGGTVARARPCLVRTGAGSMNLPASGIVVFDATDLQGEVPFLEDLATHEVGHVLGLGLDEVEGWRTHSVNALDPFFTGETAVGVFEDELSGEAYVGEGVPLAIEGGALTVRKHWREANFRDELMTGFLSETENPLSRVTLGALADMGYEVDLSTADDYELPLPQPSLLPVEASATLSRPDGSGRSFGGPGTSLAHRSIVVGANVDQHWTDQPESEVFTGLLRFDVPSPSPGVRITEAHLLASPRDRLPRDVEEATREVEVVPVTEAWAARDVTWDDRPAFGEDPVATYVQDPGPDLPTTPAFTELVAAWMRGGAPNHGLALRSPGVAEVPAFGVGYWTRATAPSRITAPWLVVLTDLGEAVRREVRRRPAGGERRIPLGDDVLEGTIYGIDREGHVVREVEVR